MAFKTVSVNVVEEVDRDPNLYVKRAEDFLRRNQYQNALTEMDQAIDYSSANKKWKYAFEKIKIYEAVGKEAGSSDFIKKYIKKLYTELALDEFYRVLRVLRKNDPLHAESIVKQNGIPFILLEVCHNSQTSESFFIGKAREFMRSGKYARAISCTKFMKDQFGDSSDLCLLNAQINMAQGSFTTALSHYKQATSHQQPRLEVFTEAVEVHIRLKQNKEAYNWIDTGLQHYPLNNKLMHLKAQLLYDDNRHQDCLNTLNTILSNDRTFADAYYLKGLIYDQAKRYPLAQRNFNKAQALNSNITAPENPDRDKFLFRMKLFTLIISTTLLFLLIAQFVLFKNGTFKPFISDSSIYVYEDILFTGKTTKVDSDYNIFPSYSKEPEMTYKVTDPEIAQVNAYGEIKGLRDGKTSVQLFLNDKIMASYDFEVVTPEVSELKISIFSNKLVIGETSEISTTIGMDYDEAEVPPIKYSSSDPSIIRVDTDGKVEAIGVGKATIKASAGKEHSSLTIQSYAKVEEVSLELPDNNLLQLGKTLQLEPVVITTPADAEFFPLEYHSSNPVVAIVSDTGEVTGIAEGEAEISISSLKGAETQFTIYVKEIVELKKPVGLNADYDDDSEAINLTWKYPDEYEQDIQFIVSASPNGGEFQQLTKTEETGVVINNPISGGKYTFKVEASFEDITSEPSILSILLPKEEADTIDLTDSGMGESQENDKDVDASNFTKHMSSAVGYWKNENPDDSFSADLKYAVVKNPDPGQYNITFMTTNRYTWLYSSFYEHAVRGGWEDVDGNRINDTDGDAIVVHSPNKFTLELRSGLRGDSSKKSFTFVRVNKNDIPSNLLENVSDLP